MRMQTQQMDVCAFPGQTNTYEKMHSQETKPSPEPHPEMTQMLGLCDSIFKMFIVSLMKMVDGMQNQMVNFNRDGTLRND